MRTHGTKVPSYCGAMVPWYHGAMVPWSHGTMVPWHHGTMAPWYHGTMVTWYHGVEMREISARMLRGRFWLENQDFGVSFGAICIIFRDTSFPTSPGSQNRLFRKIVPGVQGRRHGRGKKCLHFWGPNPSKVAKNVARPILAREVR